MDDKELVPIESATSKANEGRLLHREPQVGDWYWTTSHRKEYDYENKKWLDHTVRWLGCVTHVGSNFVKLHEAGEEHGANVRIHFDDFFDRCEYEPHPDEVIAEKVDKHKKKTLELMAEVDEVTKRLMLSQITTLPAAAESNSLVPISGTQDVKSYQLALVKAKEEDLPAIFKKIEESNKSMARWMRAKLIPLQASSEGLKKTIDVIDQRIFNVELYAGIVEAVKKVRRGKPAPPTEKIRVMQRRAYMDEECLANYQAGGMEFADIADFDKWISRSENMERILPFPRTVIAFRVRRIPKERPGYHPFVKFQLEQEDKFTYLYIRNGAQLWRLATGIDFSSELFPDFDHYILKGGKVWARTDRYGKVEEMVTDADYLELEVHRRERRDELEKKKAENHRLYKKAKDKDKKREIERASWDINRALDSVKEDLKGYEPFTPESVWYDDIGKHVSDNLRAHNRVIVILQGILDRSTVLHPHPPWQLSSETGFNDAVELVYDSARVLTSGDAPDFEAYRRRLNSTLRDGSLTIGQEDFWLLREGKIETKRRENAPYDRHRSSYYSDNVRERFKPYGDPGPGFLARCVAYDPTEQLAIYRWQRPPRNATWRTDHKRLPDSIKVPADKLFNVDAYTPGDFKIFFADPRTRADYLQWAPLLLEAEEAWAGNRGHKPNPSAKGRIKLRKKGDD